MVKLVLLLAAVCAFAALAQAKVTQCQKQTAAALANNEEPPQCKKSGKFVKKQCNDVKCWCVKGISGKPAYRGQEVPIGESYDCTKKPKRCLKELLDIKISTEVLRKAAPAYIPECDDGGRYVPLRCRILEASECKSDDSNQTPAIVDPTDPPAPPAPPCNPAATEVVGRTPTKRLWVDWAEYWTMVDYINKFTQDGKVYSFELYSNAAGRPLRIGIYRPASGTTCHVKLVQQLEYNSFPVGYNKVELTGSNVLNVQAGDMFGFTWLNLGVVAFGLSDEGHYCEQFEKPSVGGTYSWFLNRYGNRDYSIRMNFEPDCEAAAGSESAAVVSCGDTQSVGRTPTFRSKADPWEYWTMVDYANKFSEDGQVNSFELYSHASERALRVGIYRPASGTACHVKLVQELEYSSFQVGYNKVELTGSNVLNVQAGDMFGFTWINFGVVAFDYLGAGHYCERAIKPSVGGTYSWGLDRGNKDYSIRMNFVAKCETLPPVDPTEPPQPCKECWCVTPRTGKEVKKSRAQGDVEC